MRARTICILLLLSASALGQHRQAKTAQKRTLGDPCRIAVAPVSITRCEPATIYTADVNRAGIEDILKRHFDGFTMVPARGCWHGSCEGSLVIQIAGASVAELRRAAEEIRVANKQQSVLVVAPRR